MTEQPEPTGEIHGLDADRTADQVTAFAEATGTALEDWQKDYIRAAVGERRPTAYDPPADPIAALRNAMMRIGLATREVLVHPDTPAVVVERITSASPLVRVRRSSLVPAPDVVLVSRPPGVDPLGLWHLAGRLAERRHARGAGPAPDPTPPTTTDPQD